MAPLVPSSQKPPTPPGSKLGNVVSFTPPKSVTGASSLTGKIVDEVWSEVYYDLAWGWYIYTSQLIEWTAGGKSIRITYYYYPPNGSNWIFGGQYSIEDDPRIINDLLKATLAKKWK